MGFGAFAAHGLKNKLDSAMYAIFQTAVDYHFVHTLALMAVGVLMSQWQHTLSLSISVYGFLAGIIIFSGSLYLLSVTGISWLGAITPVGGLALLIAWLALAWSAFKASTA